MVAAKTAKAVGTSEEKKIGTLESMQSPEYTKFLEEGVPKLQWEMEVDLFKNGDQNGASIRMLALLNKHLDHPSAREWGDQFKTLLKLPAPTVPVAAPATGETAP